MVTLVVVLGALAVLVIAVIAVGTAVGRLGPEPARHVFEHDEALAFVVDALPDEITAVLSFEDVARILRLHLDFLHRRGVARSGGDLPDGEDPVVLDTDDGVRDVLRRGALVDFHPDPDHVSEVLAAQLAYFEAIGVLAEVAEPTDAVGPDPEVTVLGQNDQKRPRRKGGGSGRLPVPKKGGGPAER
ncbi:MAG: hypothetical protein ACKV2O_13140 [Acidimicrobiales bacterium]